MGGSLLSLFEIFYHFVMRKFFEKIREKKNVEKEIPLGDLGLLNPEDASLNEK